MPVNENAPGREEMARMRERIRLLEAVVDNFPGGLLLFDRDLKLVLCNGRQKQLLEYPPELFASGNPSMEQIFHANAARGEYGKGDIGELVEARMELVRRRVAHVFERTRPNGTTLEIRGVPLADGGFVTTYLDVTEQRRNQALVAHLAHHDILTGLPNRALFLDRLQQALARVKRGSRLAVHFIDLDRFKPVNDKFGHAAGDAVLKAIATRLLGVVRETDTVARFGGDEFVVLQADIETPANAAALARRIVEAAGRAIEIGGQTVAAGASAGIAIAPDDGIDAGELLRKADLALYLCKSAGGGTFRFHEAAAMVAELPRRKGRR